MYNKEISKKWKKDNPEKVKQQKVRYWIKHKNIVNAKRRLKYKQNPSKIKLEQKNLFDRNPIIYIFIRLKGTAKKRKILVLISKEEFINWYENTVNKCEYCDLEDLSLDKKHSNGNTLLRLTIDRKDSNLPYTLENICKCCWRCNDAKGNRFTAEEFKEISQKYIKPKWQIELNNKNFKQIMEVE